MRTIGIAPNSQKFLQTILPTDQYGGFLIYYSGTLAAGQSLVGTDLGTIQLYVGGVLTVNISAYFMNQLDNLYSGYPTYSSVTGGAYSVAVWIPSGLWFDPSNIYDVTQNENTYFRLDFPNLATIGTYASGDVEISAVHQTGVQGYLHKILPWTLQIAGNGSLLTNPPINDNNIVTAYFLNPTILSTIQLVRNSVVITNDYEGVVQAYSDMTHLVETSPGVIAVEFVESKQLGDTESGQVQYQFLSTAASGSTTLDLYYSALQWTNDKARQSYVTARAAIAARG